MKPIYTFLLLMFCSITIAQNKTKNVPTDLVVKLKDNYFNAQQLDLNRLKIGDAKLDQWLLNLDVVAIQPIGQSQITKTFLIQFGTEKDISALVQQCKSIASVAYAEPNYIALGGGECEEENLSNFPNDTNFNKQWGLYNLGTQPGIGTVVADADVDMELAWDIQTGDPNMIIAVPDTGLKMDHPDIASRIWVKSTEIPSNGIDDDSNGLVDDSSGWDWVNNDNNPTDDYGHGSNVTGIIGCVANNNLLFTGVNWNCKIMPLKVLDTSNSGTYQAMANSIFYAVDNGAKIISMSIGGPTESSLLYDALNYANQNNVLFLACMMNFNNDAPYFPAAYSAEFPNVIAVGATNPNDKRSAPFFWSSTSGSNYGSHINVVAPGNYTYGLNYLSNTGSNSYWGGTSQATPLVAGIASLIWAQNPSLTPNQIRTIIELSAQDQVGDPVEDTPGFDQYMGHGRVNAYAALQLALGLEEPSALPVSYFKIVNPIQSKQLEIISDGTFSGAFKLTIATMEGKIVEQKTVTIAAGSTIVPFTFSAGNYIVTLENQAYRKIFKVVQGQ